MKRFAKYISRAFIGFFLLIYILAGGKAAYNIWQLETIRKQDISTLPHLIDTAIAQHATGPLADWVRFRPLEETDEIIAIITPKSSQLGPDIFFVLASRSAAISRTEDALFWTQLARYRLRYDSMRCLAGAGVLKLEDIRTSIMPKSIKGLLVKQPDLVGASVLQVLDFDAKHPAANRPEETCALLARLTGGTPETLPEEKWPMMHELLRSTTAKFFARQN